MSLLVKIGGFRDFADQSQRDVPSGLDECRKASRNVSRVSIDLTDHPTSHVLRLLMNDDKTSLLSQSRDHIDNTHALLYRLIQTCLLFESAMLR